MDRALSEARCAPGAPVVVEDVAMPDAELDDGVLGTGSEAAVALEAVAAGQAACGLELGLARGEAGHDLVKSRDPGGRIKGVLLAASVVTEVPEVELVEPCLGVLGSRLVGAAAQPGVDVAGGL